MWRATLLTGLALALAPGVLASEHHGRSPADEGPGWIPLDDPKVLELVAKLDAAGAHVPPDLPLRTDERYARTSEDMQPFRGTKPWKENFLLQMAYTGPGRAIPEPENVATVKVGFIGPLEPTVSVATGGASRGHALGVPMLQGARLAVEEWNEAGGYRARGLPFELIVSNDNGLWGSSGNEIVKQAYEDKVWAILGTIDGANSHIAIRVALKAELLMINTGNTDPTFVETNIPWVARVISDDRQQAYLLADYWYGNLGLQRVAIIRASSRYGRFGVREVKDSSRRLGHPSPIEMAYEVGKTDFSLELRRVRAVRPDAVVHWGDPGAAALILNQMREMGMEQPFFGCDRTVSEEFVRLAGENAEGVMAGFPWNPRRASSSLARFRQAYGRRFGVEAETYAAHGYDGMNMLLWATQVGGLNRARIRDVIAHMPHPWPGVTGDIELSATLDDVSETSLARFDQGRWVYLSPEDLGLEQPSTLGERVDDDDAGPTPYKTAGRVPLEFPGPGREAPEPAADEIVLGWFGPGDPDHSSGGDYWRGAVLAAEELNATAGLPVRLVPRWSHSPWEAGAAQVTRMVYDDDVRAVLGAVDGPSAHLAEQVALKARVTLVSSGSTDATATRAGVPWMFSCLPTDASQSGALAASLAHAAPFAVAVAAQHDARAALRELERALAARRLQPAAVVALDVSQPDLEEAVTRLLATRPQAVVVLGPPTWAARLVGELRRGGFQGRLVGGAPLALGAFARAAGAAAEGVVVPLLWEPSPAWDAFARAYEKRWGEPPDHGAAQSYDAVRLVAEAARRVGLNRVELRDAVRGLSPWHGAAGVVRWDALGRNERPVGLATWRNGRLHPGTGFRD